MSAMGVAYSTGVDSAYWLFSHTKMTGSFQMAARFMLSWTMPWLAPPSPKNATDTWSEPRCLAAIAAPTASGTLEPTTPFAPSIPLAMSAMCMEPPLPLLVPVARCRISAIMPRTSTPFAMQCPWPRCVDAR